MLILSLHTDLIVKRPWKKYAGDLITLSSKDGHFIGGLPNGLRRKSKEHMLSAIDSDLLNQLLINASIICW